MHYQVQHSSEYFHVYGHEWPTLFVEMAEWLLETNVCVDGISFFEQVEGEEYVSATINHSSKYTKTLDRPKGLVGAKAVDFLISIISRSDGN